jgi:hypothetical protein
MNQNRYSAALRLACLDIDKMRAAALGARVDEYQVEKLFGEYLYQARKQEGNESNG